MATNCLFCKINSGEIPGNFIYEDEDLIAFADINPQAPHHYLLVPRRHIPTTLDLTADDAALIGRIYLAAGKIARQLGFAQAGFRVVNNCNEAAGQTVWHIHFHLLAGRNLTWPPG
ncbi:MAG: histidine triad nucleotide-binding protein [Desulfuromonadaceae bacterium]|nr:histidine triad nucleotide-binding protein [Desulfuromonadaceae bacterium]